MVWKQSPQMPAIGSIGSIRLVNMFGKISQDLENKVPERPKRPQTGYNMFYKDLSTKLRLQNPSLNIQELAKTVGKEWKILDPKAKQELVDRAHRNSLLYKEQIQKWKDSLSDKQKDNYLTEIRSRKRVLARRRLRSEIKRLDYPIRAKSAFNLYIKEAIDNRVKTSEPFVDVFKRIVSKWKTMSPLEREPYVESAKTDKMRYLSEMEVWKETVATVEKKETMDRLTRLKSLSSRIVKSDQKSKKVPKKPKLKAKSKTTKAKPRGRPKSLKLKTKSKTAANTKSKSKSKSVAKSKKPKKSTKAGSKSKADSSDDSENEKKV